MVVDERDRFVGEVLPLVDSLRRHRIERVDNRGDARVQALGGANAELGISGAVVAQVMLERGENPVHRAPVHLDEGEQRARGEHRMVSHYRPLFFAQPGMVVEHVQGDVELSHVVVEGTQT